MRESLPIEIKKVLSQETEFVEDLKVDHLKYLGVEGHWKVYYEEGSLSRFIYISAKPQFVFNCIYEV